MGSWTQRGDVPRRGDKGLSGPDGEAAEARLSTHRSHKLLTCTRPRFLPWGQWLEVLQNCDMRENTMAQPHGRLHPVWPSATSTAAGQQPCGGALPGDGLPAGRQAGHHHPGQTGTPRPSTWTSLGLNHYSFHMTQTRHESSLLINNENIVDETELSDSPQTPVPFLLVTIILL